MVLRITDEMRTALGENPGKPLVMSDETGKNYVLLREEQYQVLLNLLDLDTDYPDDQLRLLMQEGIESGPGIPAQKALEELRDYADQLTRQSR